MPRHKLDALLMILLALSRVNFLPYFIVMHKASKIVAAILLASTVLIGAGIYMVATDIEGSAEIKWEELAVKIPIGALLIVIGAVSMPVLIARLVRR